ncbi:MAG: SAM-dependent methyltransferase [Candidatus Scalindua rubra]|uniref:SAM-dependent methyltransferase n=1 Tax=Candidatus Scalindua rubra TaxID=1872076 RepID=A0A1E3XG26_9BACT|nr:MAG: SAM-dependent methyltransferase [Candidatus Scalindua rubra]
MLKAISKGKQITRALTKRLILSIPVLAYLIRRFLYGRKIFERLESSEALYLLGLDFHGKIVFDIGSYIGEITQFFASSVGKKGYVVAFEANPDTYKRLTQRIGRDIDPNVLAVNMAVGLTSGTCHLTVRNLEAATATFDLNIQAQIIAEGNYYECNVPMCSLDDYVASGECDVIPHFIKIDAEGAEFDILRGAIRLLKMYHPELFIEIHGATQALKEKNIENIIGFLESLNYSIYHVESHQEISLRNYRLAREGHIYCKWNL